MWNELVRFVSYPHNHFELAIRTSKELEHILESGFAAEGKGLHEKVNSVQASHRPLPATLEKNIRYVATIRNRLIHEHGFNDIPDRARFIVAFEVGGAVRRGDSKSELNRILTSRDGTRSQSFCIVS